VGVFFFSFFSTQGGPGLVVSRAPQRLRTFCGRDDRGFPWGAAETVDERGDEMIARNRPAGTMRRLETSRRRLWRRRVPSRQCFRASIGMPRRPACAAISAISAAPRASCADSSARLLVARRQCTGPGQMPRGLATGAGVQHTSASVSARLAHSVAASMRPASGSSTCLSAMCLPVLGWGRLAAECGAE